MEIGVVGVAVNEFARVARASGSARHKRAIYTWHARSPWLVPTARARFTQPVVGNLGDSSWVRLPLRGRLNVRQHPSLVTRLRPVFFDPPITQPKPTQIEIIG